jgi:hypothetical protein
METCFRMTDASGTPVAYVYFADNTGATGTGFSEKLSKDQARRVAAGITQLPTLLKRRT